MGFVKEFKEFAMKGNVMDMAVGVIIGGAFGKIVTSLVSDILMPIISVCTGGIDFTNLFVNMTDDTKYATLAAAQEAGTNVFAWGQFCQNIIDFLIVAFCIFMMIKAMNKLNRKKEEPAPEAPAGPTQEELLAEIRDLLKQK
jgi:large conductance mechanosensitive channel